MMHDGTGITTGDTAGRTADGPRSVGEMQRTAARGKRFKYLFFWGHSPRRDGTLGASCFSQWWPAPFTVDGVRYARSTG